MLIQIRFHQLERSTALAHRSERRIVSVLRRFGVVRRVRVTFSRDEALSKDSEKRCLIETTVRGKPGIVEATATNAYEAFALALSKATRAIKRVTRKERSGRRQLPVGRRNDSAAPLPLPLAAEPAG
jgi:ribosome-associated translation inhibitor RaiA